MWIVPRILAAALLVGGCAPIPSSIPANVSVGGNATLPSPLQAANDAPPKFVALNFSSLDVAHPQWWSGRIVTTTNVSSVEVRTNQFSLNIPREQFGVFTFRINVYDLPAEFLRRYNLRVIARNPAGVATEEDLPFEIR